MVLDSANSRYSVPPLSRAVLVTVHHSVAGSGVTAQCKTQQLISRHPDVCKEAAALSMVGAKQALGEAHGRARPGPGEGGTEDL